MARIPESEIERLKLQVSVVNLVEAAGIALKAHGKELVGRCPFHDDKTPSLVVSPKSNLWHCMGACQTGGSAIDWVMRFESVTFRRAVELLQREVGTPAPEHTPQATPRAAAEPDLSLAAAGDDQALLRRVIDYYQATLQQNPEALAYLDKRGLAHPQVIAHFKLGHSNRSLGLRLPGMHLKAGAAVRGQLQRLGILRDSGHEHLAGSLVIPVVTAAGEITEVYGRKLTRETQLRAGTPIHLYLPGPHRGVFNESGLVGQREAILCEAQIDALTFWCAGYRNVTASYGIEGFTDDHLAAFKRHAIERVLIAYDADDAGNAAADKLAARLMAEGFECYRVRFPRGMDANDYALRVKPATQSLGLVIRQAEWMGKGAAPRRDAVAEPAAVAQRAPIPAAVDVPALVAELEAAKAKIPAQMPSTPPAYRLPPTAPAPTPVSIADSGELLLRLGDREYRVRGIEKNLSHAQLKVWLRAACGDLVHIDTVELYQARQRAAWIKTASLELGVPEDVLRADLSKLLSAVEQRQDEIIRRQLKPDASTASAPALTPAQHDAAMALLRDPQLIERIVADVEAIGVVGEGANALLAYLACVSRKLDKPLAVLIQSTSAAGKSTLMDAILSLMPEIERVHYSAMTGQSLFYLGEHSMKHKILAIAEEEGVRQAAYALKLLQSQGELTIASTGKDPATGQLVTQEYRVEGPVMLFLTTTAIDLDEELLNRCLVLTINESREQTAAIQAKQRASRTLTGLLTKARSDDVLAAHRAAQQLLRPLAVVNPLAEQLTFASDRVRLRRDHQKYLALIDTIALLHQHQRPVRSVVHGGRTIEYIEATLDDVTLANRLAHEVLGRSLDELPAQTRSVLCALRDLVEDRCRSKAVEPSVVRFTRRELREYTRLSHSQIAVHLDRLLAFEYVIAHAGRNGQRYVYELAFDGNTDTDTRRLPGLRDPVQLTTATLDLPVAAANLPAVNADLPVHFRAASGGLPDTFRTDATPSSASAGAVIPSLVAAVDPSALPEAPRERTPHRNGAPYLHAGPKG